MTTRDIGVDDLRWIIDCRPKRCAMCSSCVASCALNALEVAVMRQDLTVSRASQSELVREHLTRPVARQETSFTGSCVGYGMYERVCPNRAIHAARNPDSRYALLARMNGLARRGGWTNLNAQRTLDHIVVGHISQMTDPTLDSERRTFDILTPFGRMLPPGEFPLRAEGGELRSGGKTPPLHRIYPVIFNGMSIGMLFTRAWGAIALATAYPNEQCGLPIRMSSDEDGTPVKLLKSKRLKYMILQIVSRHLGQNRIIRAMPCMKADPAGILIKIGQGAKPSDGGLLPTARVAPYIQAIHGIPRTTLRSPPNHQGLYSIEESVQKMYLSLNAAFGFRVPVAIKCAASATSVSVCNNLLRDPYKICGGFFIDGIQDGTGAANEVSLDHTEHPMISKLRDCYPAAVRQRLRGQIPLWAGGNIDMTGTTAVGAFEMIYLGANGVFLGRVLIQLPGCVDNEQGHYNACSTGRYPTGICTQDPRLVRRLDVDRDAQNVVDYMLALDGELHKLMVPIDNSSLPTGRSDALVTTDRAVTDKLGIQYVC